MKLSSVLSATVAGVLAVLSGTADAVPEKDQTRPKPFVRLIVKFKPGPQAQGMSAQQIRAESRRPLSSRRLQEMSAAVGGEVRYRRSLPTGGHVVSVPGVRTPQAVQAAIEALKRRPDVEHVQEDRRMFPASLPNDPYLADLWSFRPPESWPGGVVGAGFQNAWSLSAGRNVTVAVLDTGILPHPDIVGPNGTLSPATGNLVSPGYTFSYDCWQRGTCSLEESPWYDEDSYVPPSEGALDLGDFVTQEESDRIQQDFDFYCPRKVSVWHGTHVAGTVAALGNNSRGVIGGAYESRILPVRVLGKCGGYESEVAEGILWAAGVHPDIPNPHPAQVLNMSLGAEGPCESVYQSAIDAAVQAGAVVVASAGNDDVLAKDYTPASCRNVITVAATGRHGEKAHYSNHDSPAEAPVIALAAPGGSSMPGDIAGTHILSTYNPGTTSHLPGSWSYRWLEGTSMAVPHVSAAVALMRSRNPGMTPLQVRAVLTASSSVTPFPVGLSGVPTCSTGTCGAGILNAERAVKNSIAVLASSPEAVDFGAGNVNRSAAQTVRFTNANPVLPVSVGGVTIGGAAAAAYAKGADSCSGSIVQPGQSCTVEVTLSRDAVGDFDANLELAILPSQGGEAGTVVVALAGSSSAVVQAVSDTVEVPEPKAGTSVVVEAQFKNIGVESALMGALVLSSPDIMAVSSDGCSNVTLAPGASCTAKITVTPKAAGNFSGTVSLKSAAPADPGAQVAIRGVATEAPATAGATGAGGSGGGGCTALPLGQGQGDLSLLAYLAAALAFGWTRRRRQSRR